MKIYKEQNVLDFEKIPKHQEESCSLLEMKAEKMCEIVEKAALGINFSTAFSIL